MKSKAILFTLIVLAPAIFTPLFLKADVNQGIVISPTGFDLKIKTEQEYNGSFIVTNFESTPLNIEFNEGDIIDNTVTQRELEWFTVQNIDTVINAGENILVNYTLKVPVGTTPGVYTKAILVNLNSSDQKVTKINLSIPFKANIVVDSLFATQPGVIIKQFDADNKLVFNNEVNLGLTIGNASDQNLSKPIIYINILNGYGKIVYSTVLNESLASLTGNKTFNIKSQLPTQGLNDIGQYTAQVLVTDSLTNKSDIKKITFFVFNQLYIILGIIILVGLYLLVKFIKGLVLIVKVNNLEDDSLQTVGIKKEKRKKTTK